MNIGIIGAGYAAQLHKNALIKIIKEKNIYIYDINRDAAKEFAKKNDVQYCENIEHFWSIINAVIIATPNFTHFQLAKEAITHNINILCEKPMSSDLSQAKEMLELSQNTDLFCVIGFNFRFMSIISTLKEVLANKKLGNIQNLKIEIKRLHRKDIVAPQNSTIDITCGALGDLGIHLIDLLVYLFNETINTDSCTVIMRNNNKTINVNNLILDDESILSGELNNSIQFKIMTSRILNPEEVGFYLEVNSSEKSFCYDSRSCGQYCIVEQGKEKTNYTLEVSSNDFFDFSDSIYLQDVCWIESIQNNSKNSKLADFSSGYEVQYILNSVIKECLIN